MKGRILIYRSGGALADPPESRLVDQVDLETLHSILDDDLEQVPFFDTIQIESRVRPCVAFCGEHGKLKNLKVNRPATLLWRRGIVQSPKTRTSRSWPRQQPNVLVGTLVVVLTGDPEFMESI